EGEMMLGVEMPAEYTHEHHGEHDRTDRHVKTVKARKHEEGRAVHARREPQVELGVRVGVLVRLEGEERETESDGDGQPELQSAAVAGFERVVSHRQRSTG